MDCIGEAKKFIRRAQQASHREVVNQHLAMAEWYLDEALKEREDASGNGRIAASEPKEPKRKTHAV
ncbi:MAG TPA: hypothetical protein VNJ31_08795 [Methyloceanibacter sp.]|nr:hypothetical protein [Methyloceanibacter sp.]